MAGETNVTDVSPSKANRNVNDLHLPSLTTWFWTKHKLSVSRERTRST